MNISNEEIKEAYDAAKKLIIDSGIMLLPKAIITDKEQLDMLVHYLGEIDPKKHTRDYTDDERKLLNVFGTVFMQALSATMKTNPEMMQRNFEYIMQANKEDFKDSNVLDIFSKNLKENLLFHEEYEKVIDLNKKTSDESEETQKQGD